MHDHWYMVSPNLSRNCMLPAIVLLTALCIGITIICLSFGLTIIFQNSYYLPIILACMCHPKRGLLFTTSLSAVYLFLMVFISRNPAIIPEALVRVAFFEAAAGVIVFISYLNKKKETQLLNQKSEINRIMADKSNALTETVVQYNRNSRAFKEEVDFLRNCVAQIDTAIVQWNAELYITVVNPAFTRLLGRSENDLVGRKLSTLPFPEEALHVRNGNAIAIAFRDMDGKERSIVLVVSEVFDACKADVLVTVAQCIEIGSGEIEA
jgi:PAS domain S-box-containing protein